YRMKQVLTYWSFDGLSLGILLMMIITYVVFNRSSSRSLYFALAVLLFVLCFFSPLHLLSAHYLFSAHMLVHVLLLLCVGPLLVLSLAPDKDLLSTFFLF
ncbi:MAG: cytochrome c oxidase assembly protein, partial [Flavisolibacter sp.]|nr:cytochrome c oxidase assembly protein [Flavisolibacter sp.]